MSRKSFQNKLALLVIFLTALILTQPTKCLLYALNGLNLWYEKMIPALFPFMVLSGIIIRLNLTEPFVKLLQPLLTPLFKVSPSCIYGILTGFLCGFPMGAQTVALLYENKLINKAEATFLLSFCNNIGPVYFLGFVMPSLSISHPSFFLLGMYGLPFLYGVILRYTCFRHIPHYSINSTPNMQSEKSSDFLLVLDQSVWSSLSGIAKLGGYMIFFNLLFIIPDFLFGLPFSSKMLSILPMLPGMLDCLLEITGGIGTLGSQAPFFTLCVLPFGGCSCIVQTYSMISATDLSLSTYIMHKMILTAITVFFYFLLSALLF